MSATFTHLQVHSHYSLLGALPKIPQLGARAQAQGCTALALTDLGNLYGAIEFYKECKKEGIKPRGYLPLLNVRQGLRISNERNEHGSNNHRAR